MTRCGWWESLENVSDGHGIIDGICPARVLATDGTETVKWSDISDDLITVDYKGVLSILGMKIYSSLKLKLTPFELVGIGAKSMIDAVVLFGVIMH